MKKYVSAMAFILAIKIFAMDSEQNAPDDIRIDIPELCKADPISADNRADKAEEELFKRMAAMRIEQARRAQQAAQKKRPSTPPCKGAKWVEGKITIQGDQVDEFLNALKQEIKERKDKPQKQDNLNVIGITDSCTAEFIEYLQQQGYKIFPQPDGLTAWCKPGYEDQVGKQIELFRWAKKHLFTKKDT